MSFLVVSRECGSKKKDKEIHWKKNIGRQD